MMQWFVVAGIAVVGLMIMLVDLISARRQRASIRRETTHDHTRTVHRLHPWAGMDEWPST